MKKQFNSPSISLFEQLGAGIDILGQIPVPKAHRYAEDADEGEIAPSEIPANPMSNIPMPKSLSDMKFTHSLIKHLDMLYGRMLAGEISNITESVESVNEDTIDIAGMPHERRHSYYNPGHSSVTEST